MSEESPANKGHRISELFEDKEDGKFSLVLHPCDENPIVATNTAGMASLRGTKEQFRGLWEMLAESFDFDDEEGDDEE